MQADERGTSLSRSLHQMREKERVYTMMRGTVLHYVERDGNREVHIIPDGGVFDVYYKKGEDCCLSYMFGLPNYQPSENKHYDLDDVFMIAWDNFSVYEEMIDDE